MPDLDQALPIIQNLARRKANAFVHRRRFASHMREDVESELALTFVTGWEHYDSRRSSVRTFASRIFDTRLTSILRYQLAQCRQTRELQVPDPGPTAASIHEFRLDLERALAPLPRAVRETASALSWLSAVDAAEASGCSRQTINRRKQQIREALVLAGIGPDYFAGGGAPS